MRNQSYYDEADYCRDLAESFEAGREKPFLLSVAHAFDDLAAKSFARSEEVISPFSELPTSGDLPPVNTSRWTPYRKAEVVAAVARGTLSQAEACERYSLSTEEFTEWRRLVHQGGIRALRVTRIVTR